MNQPKTKIKMRSISLEELKSCPKLILSAEHWIPAHKVEECGTDNIKKEKSSILPKSKQHPMFQDIEKSEKSCVECGAGFIWTAGEQKFMSRLYDDGKIPYIIEPKRCPTCRAKKKKRATRRKNHN
jgi:hypothetical protein